MPLPSGFQPPDAAAGVEFSAAQLALIRIAQGQSVLTDPVDALNFARAKRGIEERCQRQVIDKITAQVGRENRDRILASEAENLDIPLDKLKKLLANPPEYQALMEIRAQAHLADIPAAQESLADHRRRTVEQGEKRVDDWSRAFNFSKPSRGDLRRTDRLGKMAAAEVKGKKRMKNAFRKQKEAAKPPKPKKLPWKQRLAPGAKEAGAYFMATGEGIVLMKLEQLNIAAGREADVLNAAAALDEWDARREREGLDYAGFPWPKDKK